MMNPNFQPTQDGNPHKLSIFQHVFPRTCIERFYNVDKRVKYKDINLSGFERYNSKNRRFCAERLWSQRAETVLSRKIESEYQLLADKIVSGEVEKLETSMQSVVTKMYQLWRARCILLRYNPNESFSKIVFTSGSNLTIDEQEILESQGVSYRNNDGTMPPRMLNEIYIIGDRLYANRSGDDTMTWGICKAPEGFEFLCPDASIDKTLLPVSPRICLISGLENQTFNYHGLGYFNRELLDGVHRYWFAKNPDKCLTLKRLDLSYLYK